MTEQEAIKIIDCNRPYEAIIRKAEKEAFDMAIKSLEKQSIYEQIKWERDVALDQLESIGVGLGRIMDDVKEAMEKQIPKKVVAGARYKCPSCGELFASDWKFCFECGQKLDWTVEE